MVRPRLATALLIIFLFLAGLLLVHGRAAGPQAGAQPTAMSPAQGAHYIVSCTNITSPGLYVLSSNLSGTQSDNYYCIGVFSDNVTLDGEGHALSGPLNGLGVYVNGSSRNVTVEDLEVTNYSTGLVIAGSGSRIYDVTADKDYYGINVTGSKDGVYNVNADNDGIGINIAGNYSSVYNVNADNDGIGINVTGSKDGVYNVNADNDGAGLAIMNGNYDEVEGSSFVGDGIFVWMTSVNDSFLNDTVNGRPLVYLRDVSDVVVRDAGEVLAFGSTNITLVGLNLSYSTVGAELIDVNSSRIYNVTADHDDWVGLIINGNYDEVEGSSFVNDTYVGLYLYNSGGDLIFNNLFDNYNNVYTQNSWAYWNVTPRFGKNILGGNLIGGNAWLSPNGTGFSQTCIPLLQEPDVCYEPYSLGGNNTDYLPLRYPQEVLYVATDTTVTPSSTTTTVTAAQTTTAATTTMTMTSSAVTTTTVTSSTTKVAQTTATTTSTTSTATTSAATVTSRSSTASTIASRQAVTATYMIAGVAAVVMVAAVAVAYAFLRRK